MRIFKGLENIHAVIDRHDNEWRRENGEPEVPEYTPDEAVRRNWEKTIKGGSGKLSGDRFLNASKKKSSDDNQGQDPEVEIIEAIKQDGVQHSWLYNEVEKAVRAAVAGDRKHTKIIAVFVPVIQNSKEFEEFPADESVTLPPVQEEIPVEDDTMPFEVVVDEDNTPQEPEEIIEEVSTGFDLIPESQEHPDEELAEAFNAMEEKLSETPEPEELTVVEEEQQQTADEGETADSSFRGAEEPDAELQDVSEENGENFSGEFNETPENGEAMTFDEFPVLKNDNEAPVEVEDFIEEVKEVKSETNSEPEPEHDYIEPPAIEDFEDDEVFEEPLEMLDENENENLELEEIEFNENSKNIRIE